MARKFDVDEQRDLLALSFEKVENGYLYYHYRWSHGVPVTEEERESYLKIPALGSRSAWRRSIQGRTTTSRRAYAPVTRKLLAAMPASMIVFALCGGAIAIGWAIDATSKVAKVAYLSVGTTALAYAAAIVVAKAVVRKGRVHGSS